MNFKVEKKNNNMHVIVSVTPARKNDRMQGYRTQDVLNWLKENHPEYKVEEVLQESRVHNSDRPEFLSGEWIFKLQTSMQTKTKKVPKKKKSRSQKTNVSELYNISPCITEINEKEKFLEE